MLEGDEMPVKQEKYSFSSDEVVQKVKQLVHEGNIRHVRVLQKGKVILDLPLTVGAPAAVIGIIWLPFIAAIGALGALVTECTVEVEKVVPEETSGKKE
jgi:hypothetical protein